VKCRNCFIKLFYSSSNLVVAASVDTAVPPTAPAVTAVPKAVAKVTAVKSRKSKRKIKAQGSGTQKKKLKKERCLRC